MLLMGDDGGLQFDLGNGLQCSAEITGYQLSIARDTLRTTRQGDEWETYVAGMKRWDGSLNFNIRLAQLDDLFTAAQIIPAIMVAEDEAPIPARFFLQRRASPTGCPPGREISPAAFVGTLLLSEITVEISDPTQLIRGAARFQGTGLLEFQA